MQKVLEPQQVLGLRDYLKLHLYIKLTSFDAKTKTQ